MGVWTLKSCVFFGLTYFDLIKRTAFIWLCLSYTPPWSLSTVFSSFLLYSILLSYWKCSSILSVVCTFLLHIYLVSEHSCISFLSWPTIKAQIQFIIFATIPSIIYSTEPNHGPPQIHHRCKLHVSLPKPCMLYMPQSNHKLFLSQT